MLRYMVLYPATIAAINFLSRLAAASLYLPMSGRLLPLLIPSTASKATRQPFHKVFPASYITASKIRFPLHSIHSGSFSSLFFEKSNVTR